MFNVGTPVWGDEFIDRQKELRVIKEHIRDNQNVIIKAPRRFGKTSLIKEAFRVTNKKAIYIDMKRALNLRDLALTIIDETYRLFQVQNFTRRMKEGAVNFLRSIRAQVDVKILEDIEVTITMLESKQTEESDIALFEYALETPMRLKEKTGESLVVAFDEFQDLVDLTEEKRILDMVRSILQQHDGIGYIFAGSQESLMRRIFEDKNSPFFHFGITIELEGLDIDELVGYAKRKFNAKGIMLPLKPLEDVMRLLKGQPYYCMRVLRNLYVIAISEGKTELTEKDIQGALETAFMDVKTYIEDIISKIKGKKGYYEVLYAVANGGDTSIEDKNEYRIKKSLEEMGYLKHKSRGIYEVTDAFLEIYLRDELDF